MIGCKKEDNWCNREKMGCKGCAYCSMKEEENKFIDKITVEEIEQALNEYKNNKNNDEKIEVFNKKNKCKSNFYNKLEDKAEISARCLEIHIANELDDQQWKNWQQVLKYIDELQEKIKDLQEIEKTHKEENGELRKMLQHRVEYTQALEKDLFQNCTKYVVPKEKIRKIKERLKEQIKRRDDGLITDVFFDQIDIMHQIEILDEILEEN